MKDVRYIIVMIGDSLDRFYYDGQILDLIFVVISFDMWMKLISSIPQE